MIQVVQISQRHFLETSQYKDSNEYIVSIIKDTRHQEEEMNVGDTSLLIFSQDEPRQVFGSPSAHYIQTLTSSGLLQITSVPQVTLHTSGAIQLIPTTTVPTIIPQMVSTNMLPSLQWNINASATVTVSQPIYITSCPQGDKYTHLCDQCGKPFSWTEDIKGHKKYVWKR